MVKIRYFSGIESMPTPLMRIDNLVNKLVDGNNIIYMIHNDKKVTLITNVKLMCEEKGLEVHLCDITQVSEPPRQYFLKLTEISTESILTVIPVNRILSSVNCPNVTILNGLESIDKEKRKLWISFINEWIRHSKNYVRNEWDTRVMLLVLGDTGLLEQINEEPGWEIYWYWNWITKNETNMVLLCLMLDGSIPDIWKPWVEAILPEIAGPDFNLLQWLYQTYEQMADKNSVIKLLKKYAKDKGLITAETSAEFAKYRTMAVYDDNNEPSKNLYKLWEKGIVIYTREDGLFFSSAFLAGIGDNTTICHRLWRGMSAYLMPVIDQARLKLCSSLNRKYMDEWKAHCAKEKERDEKIYGNHTKSQDNSQDTLYTEMRGVYNFLIQKGYAENCRHKRLFDSVKRLKDTRNILAHGRLMDREDFTKAVDAGQFIQGLVL